MDFKFCHIGSSWKSVVQDNCHREAFLLRGEDDKGIISSISARNCWSFPGTLLLLRFFVYFRIKLVSNCKINNLFPFQLRGRQRPRPDEKVHRGVGPARPSKLPVPGLQQLSWPVQPDLHDRVDTTAGWDKAAVPEANGKPNSEMDLDLSTWNGANLRMVGGAKKSNYIINIVLGNRDDINSRANLA